MKVNQIKLGSILSYAQMALSMAIGLVYTPVMIRLLGQSEYGLYNTVASTVGMLSLLNLGFGSGYIKFFSIYKKNNDDEKISRLNGMFLEIFSVISAIALLIGFILSNNLNLVFDEGLATDEYRTAKTLMILLTVNITISFPMSVIGNIIIANERFIFNKVVGMVNTILSPLLTLPLLMMGYRSIGMVACTLLLTIIADVLQTIYVLHTLKAKFVFSHFDNKIFRQLFSYTAVIAINMLIDQVNWNIDKILLARFKGTTSVAIYAVGYNLHTHFMAFSTAVSGLYTPRIHRIVNETKENKKLQSEQLTSLLTRVGRMQFLILGLIAGGFIVFGKQFIQFWVGDGYGDSYYIALLLMIPSVIPLIQNLGIEVQRAQNNHRFRAYVYAGMAVINLGVSVVLCQKYGPVGSAIGTAIALLVANGAIMNIYYHKRCNIDIRSFWKSVSPLLLGALIPLVLMGWVIAYIELTNPIVFAFLVVAYAIIYFLVQWIIGMNSYERKLVVKSLRKVARIRR